MPSHHIGKHFNIPSPILSKNIPWHFHVNLLWYYHMICFALFSGKYIYIYFVFVFVFVLETNIQAAFWETVPLDMCTMQRPSLCICAVWSAFPGAVWITKDPRLLQADSEDFYWLYECAGWSLSLSWAHMSIALDKREVFVWFLHEVLLMSTTAYVLFFVFFVFFFLFFFCFFVEK